MNDYFRQEAHLEMRINRIVSIKTRDTEQKSSFKKQSVGDA